MGTLNASSQTCKIIPVYALLVNCSTFRLECSCLHQAATLSDFDQIFNLVDRKRLSTDVKAQNQTGKIFDCSR
jgi:hypothetical protein